MLFVTTHTEEFLVPKRIVSIDVTHLCYDICKIQNIRVIADELKILMQEMEQIPPYSDISGRCVDWV